MFLALSLSPRFTVAGVRLPTPAWYFYALGPQLALCLALGYWAARRRDADLLDWLTGAFLASLVPVAGVLAMLWLWWRGPHPPAGEGV